MNSLFIRISAFLFLSSFSLHAARVAVEVDLSPAGDFVASSSNVVGHLWSKGTQLYGKNIYVPVSTLKTGNSLRDKHTKDYLKASKFSKIKVLKAIGNSDNQSFRALIEIAGVQKKVKGTFKRSKKKVRAKFTLKLSDFGIGPINYMVVKVSDEVHITADLPIKF